MRLPSFRAVACLALLVPVAATPVASQARRNAPATPTAAAKPLDSLFYPAITWRNIGPWRGGRSVAVTGVPSQPLTYFAGFTGGGLWRTDDAGINWRNVSDGFFKTGSVGAIAVAPSDPNVIYVGMGEHAIRGQSSTYGDGVYKSTDQGKTWTHVGLAPTRQISAIAGASSGRAARSWICWSTIAVLLPPQGTGTGSAA